MFCRTLRPQLLRHGPDILAVRQRSCLPFVISLLDLVEAGGLDHCAVSRRISPYLADWDLDFNCLPHIRSEARLLSRPGCSTPSSSSAHTHRFSTLTLTHLGLTPSGTLCATARILPVHRSTVGRPNAQTSLRSLHHHPKKPHCPRLPSTISGDRAAHRRASTSSKVRSGLDCHPTPCATAEISATQRLQPPRPKSARARARAHAYQLDASSEPLAPRVCHPRARTAQRRGRERRHRAPSDRCRRQGSPKRKGKSTTRFQYGPWAQAIRVFQKVTPIPLVTDATADLPAPIFLIAASPIVIRQVYFKRPRSIYLSSYQLRPCILILTSNVWPECSHTQRQGRDGHTHAYFHTGI